MALLHKEPFDCDFVRRCMANVYCIRQLTGEGNKKPWWFFGAGKNYDTDDRFSLRPPQNAKDIKNSLRECQA
ncbi:hypothetical protein RvY_18423 [Ramazzottius varieornatus]|uniref:Uncharacterized protein n=1 Tax=Ramazzottius varieornatus TaxID=947166 RepID=A0A1D1W8Z4_RAMVA|nr:hypothetical protein RvY_18423 [Ramazzottius varieornatus]